MILSFDFVEIKTQYLLHNILKSGIQKQVLKNLQESYVKGKMKLARNDITNSFKFLYLFLI